MMKRTIKKDNWSQLCNKVSGNDDNMGRKYPGIKHPKEPFLVGGFNPFEKY